MKYLIKLILITCIMGLCMSSDVEAQCNNQDDYTALRALYLSTDGDNWTHNNNCAHCGRVW